MDDAFFPFGVTVITALQVPAFRALTPVPDTLQTLLVVTRSEYFPPEGTVRFARERRRDFDAVVPFFRRFDGV